MLSLVNVILFLQGNAQVKVETVVKPNNYTADWVQMIDLSQPPEAQLHIADSDRGVGFVIERRDKGTYVKAAAGTEGSGFLYDQNSKFMIYPTPYISHNGDGTSEGKSLAVVGTQGNVGIGTWTPTTKLHVEGNIFASGDITANGSCCPSDLRLKANIQPLSYGLKELIKLNPVSFYYNGLANSPLNVLHFGLIAQELNQLVPELVSKGNSTCTDDPYLQIRESEIKYIIINAVKEQQQMITDLKKELSEVHMELDALQKLVYEK